MKKKDGGMVLVLYIVASIAVAVGVIVALVCRKIF